MPVESAFHMLASPRMLWRSSRGGWGNRCLEHFGLLTVVANAKLCEFPGISTQFKINRPCNVSLMAGTCICLQQFTRDYYIIFDIRSLWYHKEYRYSDIYSKIIIFDIYSEYLCDATKSIYSEYHIITSNLLVFNFKYCYLTLVFNSQLFYIIVFR